MKVRDLIFPEGITNKRSKKPVRVSQDYLAS